MGPGEGDKDQATTILPEVFLASLRAELPEVLAVGINPLESPGESFAARRERVLAQIRLVDRDAFMQHLKDRHSKYKQQQIGAFTEVDYLDLFALEQVLLHQTPDDPIVAFKSALGQFLLNNLPHFPAIIRQLQDSCNYAYKPGFEVAPIRGNEYANTILQFSVAQIQRGDSQKGQIRT